MSLIAKEWALVSGRVVATDLTYSEAMSARDTMFRMTEDGGLTIVTNDCALRMLEKEKREQNMIEEITKDMTDLDEYQCAALAFENEATCVDSLSALNNASLGLSGESGEVADIVKKVIFHEHPLDEITRLKLLQELGDVQWYVAQGARALGASLSQIATMNIAKLKERHGVRFNKSASIAKEAAKMQEVMNPIYTEALDAPMPGDLARAVNNGFCQRCGCVDGVHLADCPCFRGR